MAKVVSTLTARKRRDAEATHDALLKAARAMMAESGPETLTVSEVAHRAGVNRTTAYQHFRTREDLMGAVLAQVANETSLMLKTDLSPSQLLDSMTEYFLDHPEIARLWMFQMLQNIQLPNRDGWNRYMKAMCTLAAVD
jgi:AcrR family transcriptional regulator